MIEFVVGLVLGSIFGVVADRLWSAIEQRPRLRLKVAFYQSTDGTKGIAYTVQNVGSTDVPDYKIALFHPLRGSLYAFNSEQRGPLLPHQSRSHRCPLEINGRPSEFVSHWILTERDTLLDDVKIKDFALRLVMKDSDLILLESEKIGNAIARYWFRLAKHGSYVGTTWEERKDMDTPPRWGFIGRWIAQRRAQKEVERLLREARANEARLESAESA